MHTADILVLWNAGILAVWDVVNQKKFVAVAMYVHLILAHNHPFLFRTMQHNSQTMYCSGLKFVL
jgi:hypothetical protein